MGKYMDMLEAEAEKPDSKAETNYYQTITDDKYNERQAIIQDNVRRAKEGLPPARKGGRHYDALIPTQAEAAVGHTAQGAMLGGADETGAAWDVGYYGMDHDQALKERRDQLDLAREEYPITALSSNILGGVGGMLGAGRVSKYIMQRALPGVAPVAANIPAIGRYALGGAAGGAVAGFNEGEGGFGPRINDAQTGAMFGPLGAAIPGVSKLVGYVGRRVFDKNFAEKLLRGKATQAHREIMRALDADDITPQEAVKRLREGGNMPITLTDVAGENVRGLARSVTQAPGPVRRQAGKLLKDRSLSAPARVIANLRGQLGGKLGNYYEDMGRLKGARGRLSNKAYKKAYQEEIPVTDDLLEILERPAMKQALARANKNLANKGKPEVKLFDEDGELIQDFIPVEHIDMMKRLGLDSLIERHRDKVTGRLDLKNPDVRTLYGLRAEFMGMVDDMAPDFKAARKIHAGLSEDLDALARGRDFLKSDAEVTRDVLKRMSGTEREMYRRGVIRAVQDRVDNMKDGANVADQLWGRASTRKKLREVFPNKKAYDKFAAKMETESHMGKVKNEVGPETGSPTVRTANEQASTRDVVMATVEPVTAAVSMTLRSLGAKLRLPDPKVRENIGRILFEARPGAREAAIEMIEKAGNSRVVAVQAVDEIYRAVATGTGGAAGQNQGLLNR